MSAVERPAVTRLELAASAELVEQTETFTRALLGRLSSGATLEVQSTLVASGVEAGRQLWALRELGYDISDETIAFAFDAIEDGVRRMIDLMPPDERRRS